jgi:dipeptidase
MSLLWMLVVIALMLLHLNLCHCCSTIAAGPLATVDGSVIVSHSNDGNGDVAGNIHVVLETHNSDNATRAVSGGNIPQVPVTYQYFTEGYAISNIHQVVLGESTCSGIYQGNQSLAMLNIVDLGQLAMERASTAREAIEVMGNLSTEYGYYDAGESLFVGDQSELWVFHILPDETGSHAIWAAQRIPDDHVSTVMNSFIIRDIDLTDRENFLFSENIKQYTTSTVIDFTAKFSGPNEVKCKYSSGRRIWAVFDAVAPSMGLSPFYVDLVASKPYPVSAKPDYLVDVPKVTAMMRIYYRGTPFDMSLFPKLSGGAFLTPSRWTTDADVNSEPVCWERPIATFKSIVSFVGQMRSMKSNGVIWFAPHSSLTSQYVPFLTTMNVLPVGYTSNSLQELGRNESAYWAFKYLHNVMQIRSYDILLDIEVLQKETEETNRAILEKVDCLDDGDDAQAVLNDNAKSLVSKFWTFSDTMIMKYSDGYCNFDCSPDQPYHLGYRQEWLHQVLT